MLLHRVVLAKTRPNILLVLVHCRLYLCPYEYYSHLHLASLDRRVAGSQPWSRRPHCRGNNVKELPFSVVRYIPTCALAASIVRPEFQGPTAPAPSMTFSRTRPRGEHLQHSLRTPSARYPPQVRHRNRPQVPNAQLPLVPSSAKHASGPAPVHIARPHPRQACRVRPSYGAGTVRAQIACPGC